MKTEASTPPLTLEESINKEGIDTLFLLARLHHPVIREQIIGLLCEGEDANREAYCDDPFYVPQSREQIEQRFDRDLVEIESSTPISFEGRPSHTLSGGRELIDLEWRWPFTGEKPTERMMGIIEAHEKGHVIRPYSSGYLRRIFQEGFEQSAVEYTDADYQYHSEGIRDERKPLFEEAREDFFDYLFSASEIVERMSQLKNYFSLRDHAPFIKEHLDYARAHYIQDTGMDNYMTHFFQAITPEKEKAFLRLINTGGI